MKNTDKVTMTVGQLKKLIKESNMNNRRDFIERLKRISSDGDGVNVYGPGMDGLINIIQKFFAQKRYYWSTTIDVSNKNGWKFYNDNKEVKPGKAILVRSKSSFKDYERQGSTEPFEDYVTIVDFNGELAENNLYKYSKENVYKLLDLIWNN